MSHLSPASEARTAPPEPGPRGYGRQVLLVTGMHRSGTSATTGVLGLLGASMPRGLMPAIPGVNEAGFFEPSRIVAIHDEMLALAGSSWHDTSPLPEAWFRSPAAHGFVQRLREAFTEDYGDAPLAALKDPRICRFAHLWIEVLEGLGIEPLFVIPSRHPAEVAASLSRRDGFPSEKSQLLWLQHVLLAEHASRGYRRAFLSYEEMMTDPPGVLNRVGRDLGLRWPTRLDDVRPRIQEFLARKHQHNRVFAQQGTPAAIVLPLAAEAYALIEGMAGSPRVPDVEAFDRLRRTYVDAERLMGGLLRKLDSAHETSRAEAAAREGELHRAVTERETLISSLQAAAADSEARMAAQTLELQSARAESTALEAQTRAGKQALDQALAALDERRTQLEQLARSHAETLRERDLALSARDAALNARDQALSARDAELSLRDRALRAGGQTLQAMQQALLERDRMVLTRESEILRLKEDVSGLVARSHELDRQILAWQAVVQALRDSSSWRLTAPLRAVTLIARRFLRRSGAA